MPALFLHPVLSGRSISRWYRRAFSEAVELYVLSAYLRSWDPKLVINKNCRTFAFIVGRDFGITRKQACRDVLKWIPKQWKPFFLVAERIAGFHPKALFWRTKNGSCHSLVGSSNLTEAGWKTNYEANVLNKLTPNEFSLVREWLDGITERSLPITKRWIDEYEEAKPSKNARRGKHGKSLQAANAISLPSFRGQAKMLRERRAKKRQFAKVRSTLLSAIRRRAAGTITNPQFYDIFERTWVEHPSRIQGYGWQIKGLNSNFRPLCRGLVSIIDADPRERDHVVVQVIDDLKKRRVPTRRAVLSELLCHFFPADFPVADEPVTTYTRPYIKAPYGSSEGARYLLLAISLRSALASNPQYPAKDLLELDGLIWAFQDMQKP
jgi:hypothetical protein